MYNFKRDAKRMPLRKKLFIIGFILLVVRIITCIPLPMVNREYLEAMSSSMLSGGLFGMMTGASFERMSLFALSISPYITASIVIQLLAVCIPALDDMRKDGKTGEEKYKKVITFTGVGLAFIQALFMSIGFGRQGLIEPYNAGTVALATILWTAGASVFILIGEFIEWFGIGSGISFLLLFNIISTIPADMKVYHSMFVSGKPILVQIVFWAAFVLVFFALVLACTFLTSTTKTIHIMQSGKIRGHVAAGRSTMPIPLVTCSVMPIIFAGSLCSLPAIIVQLTGSSNTVLHHISCLLSPTYWFDTTQMWYTLGVIIYVALTYMFTSFYLGMSFNAVEIANRLKQQGATIPGIRPGKPTVEYLERNIKNVAYWGNTLLTGLIIVMYAITGLTGLGSLSMSSTSAIIAVSIINELFMTIKGEMATQHITPLFGAASSKSRVGFLPGGIKNV